MGFAWIRPYLPESGQAIRNYFAIGWEFQDREADTTYSVEIYILTET